MSERETASGADPLPEDAADPSESLEERLALGGRGLREHTARGAVVNSAFQIGLAGVGLLKRVGVAAFLTAAEFGFWGLLITILIALTFLKQVGISDKYVQQSEPDQERAFQKAFTLELAYTACFFAVGVLALPVYALIYGRPDIVAPGAVLLLALLASTLHTPIWIAYRQMRFVRQRLLESIDPIASTAITIGLAIMGFGYWSLVIGLVAGTTAGAVVALATCPYRIRLRYEPGTLREYFDFSWPLAVSGVSGVAVVQGAMIVGNYTVGLAGLGAIGLAYSFSTFADRVDSIIRRTIYPAVAAVRERTDLLFEVFEKSNRVALMWGLPFGVGLALFAPDLVEFVLGERWQPAEGLLQAFGLILGFRQIAFNWTVFFSAVGNTRPMAVNGIASLIAFAAITAPLMFLLGIEGFAIGMAATVVVQVAIRGYYLKRLFAGFRLLSHIARAVAPTVPAVVAVSMVRLLESGPRSVALAIAELALYVAVTVAATVAVERDLIRELSGYLARRPRAAGAGGAA